MYEKYKILKFLQIFVCFIGLNMTSENPGTIYRPFSIEVSRHLESPDLNCNQGWTNNKYVWASTGAAMLPIRISNLISIFGPIFFISPIFVAFEISKTFSFKNSSLMPELLLVPAFSAWGDDWFEQFLMYSVIYLL